MIYLFILYSVVERRLREQLRPTTFDAKKRLTIGL
jgi:hypothetical protein